MKKISIVVPMYNEEEMIPLFFETANNVIKNLDNKYKDTDGCIASRRLFDTCGVSYREFNKDVDKITINLNN